VEDQLNYATTTETDTPTGAPPVSTSQANKLKSRRRIRAVKEWVVILFIALAAALGLRTWVVQAFYIPSASMVPTLQIGDRILVNKLEFDFHSIDRGDIVVFRRPAGDDVDPGIADLVKRVIGLSGQKISFGPGNTDEVFINGHLISQPWEPAGTVLGDACPRTPVVIPKGDVFMMGDNRAESYDSRCFGPVPKSLIVGRVVARIWPVNRLHIFGI
jgi:signal peptidase I